MSEGENKTFHEREEQLIELINSDESLDFLVKELENYHENDIAEAIEKLDKAARKKLYNILGAERMSEIFAYIDNASEYISELDIENAADIIENMDVDDAIDLLEDVGGEIQERLINLLNEEAKEDIKLVSSYGEDEIGSQMTTNFVEMNDSLSVKEAMRELVKQAVDNDNISTIYIKNKEGKFAGTIELTDLIRAREFNSLEDLIRKSYPSFYATEKVSDCIEKLKEYAEDSIPILDAGGVTLGVITAHDIVEFVEDELSEDYARFAGLSSEEDLKESWFTSIKKRLPWLTALLGLGLIVSTVVGMFESVIAQLTVIIGFQSLILGMAGNAGTQSLAVTIRVLMDDSVSGKRKAKLVLKEVKIAMANGLLLGGLSFAVIGLYIMLILEKEPLYSFAVSGCVGVALATAMTMSGFVGTIIPIFFHKIKIDPAVASGPLITTINDLIGVVTYYGLALIFLINIMGL